MNDIPADIQAMADSSPLDLSIPEELFLPVITCTVLGIVDEADLQALVDSAPLPPVATDLKKIRERHHTVARLVASGMQQGLVAAICNYTEGYLSTLLNNPAMQELIGHYRASKAAAMEAVQARLEAVAMDAVDTLVERMEGDGLDNQELLSLAKLGFDRSGHGPTQKQQITTETHLFDYAELAKLHQQAKEASKDSIVDLEVARQVDTGGVQVGTWPAPSGPDGSGLLPAPPQASAPGEQAGVGESHQDPLPAGVPSLAELNDRPSR